MSGRETVRSSNAATVLRTLVPQARAIFKLLAEHQMEDRDEGEEEGESPVTTPADSYKYLNFTLPGWIAMLDLLRHL